MPTINKTIAKIKRNHFSSIFALKLLPKDIPGIEPIKSESNK